MCQHATSRASSPDIHPSIISASCCCCSLCCCPSARQFSAKVRCAAALKSSSDARDSAAAGAPGQTSGAAGQAGGRGGLELSMAEGLPTVRSTDRMPMLRRCRIVSDASPDRRSDPDRTGSTCKRYLIFTGFSPFSHHSMQQKMRERLVTLGRGTGTALQDAVPRSAAPARRCRSSLQESCRDLMNTVTIVKYVGSR